jgi:signal transduction histidine kinase
MGIAGINIDITERKQAEVSLKDSKEKLQKFATHLQNVREEEKIALAREIHDDLGQILVALKIDVGLLKQRIIKGFSLAGSEDILTRFDNLVGLIDNTIRTARRIMNGLRPEQLELLGFVGAIKMHLREFEERHKLQCELICNIPDYSKLEINPQQTLALFRILQEALNNVAKHAKAKHVTVQLNMDSDKLKLQISDNGIGFDEKNNGVVGN